MVIKSHAPPSIEKYEYDPLYEAGFILLLVSVYKVPFFISVYTGCPSEGTRDINPTSYGFVNSNPQCRFQSNSSHVASEDQVYGHFLRSWMWVLI